MIPNFNKITDMDKKKYIKSSYKNIKQQLLNLSIQTKNRNNNFDFELDEHGELDCIITFYLDRMEKTYIRLWLGSIMGYGAESIFISYDNKIGIGNSWNEMIICEEDKNSFRLKMTMNVYGKNDNSLEGIVANLWSHICVYLK